MKSSYVAVSDSENEDRFVSGSRNTNSANRPPTATREPASADTNYENYGANAHDLGMPDPRKVLMDEYEGARVEGYKSFEDRQTFTSRQ